ncbi:hypothetical protein GCM10009780_64180 [Actinomadura alba]
MSSRHAAVTDALANLLMYAPVPPQVRAAAYRALAGMPGIKSTGKIQDRRGREGIGITLPVAVGGENRGDPHFIFDPKTALMLARPRLGAGALVLEAGWTNVAPRIPARP